MYFKKMVGSKCYLSPMCVDDFEIYAEWLNDLEITRYLTLAPTQITSHAEKEAIVQLSKEHNYAIVDLGTDALIGNCGLMDLDPLNRTAEIGVFIGDKKRQGQGYGREAMSLLLRYGFDYLNLNNIMLRVYSFNERAIKSYKALGFKTIGKRRKAIVREGKESDILFMDMLASEFHKNEAR